MRHLEIRRAKTSSFLFEIDVFACFLVKLVSTRVYGAMKPRIAVLVSAAVVSLMLAGTLLGFFRPGPEANVSKKNLTFAERVAYQRAIEEVYWRHRIWPEERLDPKPPLDSVMSQAQLEKKVAAYLRDSDVLQHSQDGPITAEKLQAEMDRMASHTREPDVLREIFNALGNNAFVIAECLARPLLAEGLLRKIARRLSRTVGLPARNGGKPEKEASRSGEW